MNIKPFHLKMEDYCFLDSLFIVLNSHLGRAFFAVVLLFLYKELTMGMYRTVIDMTGKVFRANLVLYEN